MTYTNSGRPPGDDGDREAWTRGEPVPAADPEDGAVSSAVNDSADERESAGQAPCPLPCVEADTSLPMPAASAAGQRSSFKTAATVRADALRMLGCVRLATPSQMARVITADTSDGRSYVRRAMLDLQSLGLAEPGHDGRRDVGPQLAVVADGDAPGDLGLVAVLGLAGDLHALLARLLAELLGPAGARLGAGGVGGALELDVGDGEPDGDPP